MEVQELQAAQVSKVSKDRRVLLDVPDFKGQLVRQAIWVIPVFKVQRETLAYLVSTFGTWQSFYRQFYFDVDAIGAVRLPSLFVIMLEVLSRKFRGGLPLELPYADNLAVMAETEELLLDKLNKWKADMK